MQYSVRFEFTLQRRVPWDGEHEMMIAHVGAVADTVVAHGAVDGVAVESDAPSARAMIEISISATNQPTADAESRHIVARAIRDAGAYHRGLLSPPDELRIRPDLNAWSGLRTPTWQVRRTTARRHRKRVD